MLAVLLPLHEKMERQGPTTLKEIAFVQVRLRIYGVRFVGYYIGLFAPARRPGAALK